MLKFDKTAILQQFDGLVRNGDLHYSKSTPIIVTDNGFKFEFRITPVLSSKPQLDDPHPSFPPNPAVDNESDKAASGIATPTSDIDYTDPAFLITPSVHHTHTLILNKFSVFRPQYLLLTSSPAHLQVEPLDSDDYAAAWTTLLAFEASEKQAQPDPTTATLAARQHYVIYNCGRAGGSSRRHKHMQIFDAPAPSSLSASAHNPSTSPPENGDDAFNSDAANQELELLGDRRADLAHAPFTHFFHEFDPAEFHADADAHDIGARIEAIAAKHLAQCRDTLGLPAPSSMLSSTPRSAEGKTGAAGDRASMDALRIPHNTVMTTRWLMTIPRRVATVDKALSPVSAAGMVGNIWLGSETQLKRWQELGLRNVLAGVGAERTV